MKPSMNIGKLSIPVAQEMKTGSFPAIGSSAFGSLFDGALTLKVGDGSKATMTKNAAYSEGGNYAAHSNG